jgi:hypothetical protein
MRQDRPKVSITLKESVTNLETTPHKGIKELNFMDKKILREKLEGRLLKETASSLKSVPLKELVKQYYASQTSKKEAIASKKAAKTPAKKSSTETMIEKKIRLAVAKALAAKAKKRKTYKEQDELDDEFLLDDGEEPVDSEFADDMEGEDDMDLGLDDEDMEDDEDLDLFGDEDEIEDDEMDIEDDEMDIEDDEMDIEDDEDDLDIDEDDLEVDEDDLDLDLEDDELDLEDDELDSEIASEEDAMDKGMTEAQKKKLRMKRMKDKAMKLAKKTKVREMDNGADGYDPSEGVDAILKGNEDLFDAVPDLNDTANVPNDNLGQSDPPKASVPMTDTSADSWITSRKVEKLNYKTLMTGGYFKKMNG